MIKHIYTVGNRVRVVAKNSKWSGKIGTITNLTINTASVTFWNLSGDILFSYSEIVPTDAVQLNVYINPRILHHKEPFLQNFLDLGIPYTTEQWTVVSGTYTIYNFPATRIMKEFYSVPDLIQFLKLYSVRIEHGSIIIL